MTGHIRRYILPRLLWVDCIAAGAAGIVAIACSDWLGSLYGLSRERLLFIGAVNLTYGAYSCSLAVRVRRPMSLIKLLVFANVAWAVVCVWMALDVARFATLFGFCHLLGEATFVGTLAALEWRQREALSGDVRSLRGTNT